MKSIHSKYWYKTIILIITILITVQSGQSQNFEQIKITGSYSHVTAPDFFSSLEKFYGISFYYKKDWINTAEITCTFKDTPLIQALNQAFKGQKLNFKIFQENSIIVYPGTTEQLPELGSEDARVLVIGDPINRGRFQRAKVSGRVLEGKTMEPLSGAIVFSPESKTGVATDAHGRYTIEMPTGDGHLEISFLSFEKQIQKIRLIQDGNADFELFEQTHSISEVTVVSESSKGSKAQMSMVKMNAIMIRELPVLMGEADLIKSLVLMPGVQSVGEMSSGFNVRGGNTDQNLVLLNGAPVFNTSHMFGFFSMINPDNVEDVTLFMGGIPSSYGERISSVMDVQMKDGNDKSLRINGGIGLVNSRLTIDGPFAKKKKSSFMIGGRSTYSDWMLARTKNATFMNSVAHFYDINGTANIEISPKNHLKLMGYLSSDLFNLNTSSLYKYANSLGSLNWKLNLSEKLVSNLSLAYSKYDLKVNQKEPLHPQDDYILKSNIQYSTLKYALSLYPNDKHRISSGLQAIGYRINPGEISPSRTITNIVKLAMRREQAAEMALFVDDNFDLSDKFAFDLGLRYTHFINYGPGTVYNYAAGIIRSESSITDSTVFKSGDIIKSYGGFEPRLSAKYNLHNGGSLRLSYQRIHQFISQISNTAVISPADYWKSADQNIAPMINDQLAIGYFKSRTNSMFETSVEVYYKKLQNLTEYVNGARLLMNNHIETDLINANGYSYGIELLAKKSMGRLNGWLSYTYSRTFRKAQSAFAEQQINGGGYYPSVYDKPHDLAAVMNYKISRRWRFSGNFVFSSGRPITLPEEKYYYGGNEIVIYSDRNKYRMPPYHRMDLSITLDENLRKKRVWKGSWTFSIYNLYGRKNPYSVFYRKEPSLQSADKSEYAIYKLSIIGVPIPSITYNFKF